jgi:hypothetical protein
VARLLPPESSSVERVSREVGISVATLERWRAAALANGAVAGSQRWTAAARLEAVIVTAAMDEAARSAWCREQGLYPAELDAWKRDAIAGLGEPRAASAVEARGADNACCQRRAIRTSPESRTAGLHRRRQPTIVFRGVTQGQAPCEPCNIYRVGELRKTSKTAPVAAPELARTASMT